ncbi:unnamed protein product, partial [Scytosiphon promiscuus]
LVPSLFRVVQYLNTLYCKGIGLKDESIFGFSVQTFTTPSLVRLLADASSETPSPLLPNPDGGEEASSRALEGDREAVIAAQQQAAAGGDQGDENAFLEHDITIHRRFLHVFRDLEYALQSPGTALDVATLAANPGPGSEPVRLWLEVLSALQYMD